MSVLNQQQLQLGDIQGRLFELSLKNGYDSSAFIKAFMNSKAAAALDDIYDRLQWAGEEYILEELNEEVGDLTPVGKTYSNEVLYWTGYTYRYWHYYTGESSKEIYKIADPEIMNQSWLGFHTLSINMAIDDLKDVYERKNS